MYFVKYVCKDFTKFTIISLIVCTITLLSIALIFSGAQLATDQSAATCAFLILFLLTLDCWAEYTVECLPKLNAVTVPIGSVMVALSGKGVICPDLHLWVGVSILALTILASSVKMFKDIPNGVELSATVSRFITCCTALFGIPFLLILILK